MSRRFSSNCLTLIIHGKKGKTIDTVVATAIYKRHYVVRLTSVSLTRFTKETRTTRQLTGVGLDLPLGSVSMLQSLP